MLSKRVMIANLAEAEACVAGRVIAVDDGRADGNARVVVEDESGRVVVVVEARAAGQVKVGDLVAVDLGAASPSGGSLRARNIEVLTPYRATVDLFNPATEYGRLRGAGAHRIAHLRTRARALTAMRAFFAARGYLEVDPPVRVRTPGLEPHLVAMAAEERFLITSPEYHMKRLLAGGLERIYAIVPCFRKDELGSHHLDEFRMLEWYLAYGTLEQLLVETEALIAELAVSLCGSHRIPHRGTTLDLSPPFTRITVSEAFERFAGVRIDDVGDDAAKLCARARASGIALEGDAVSFDEVFSQVMVDRVEPALAQLPCAFLTEYPASQAALARLSQGNPAVCERFELYVGGLELANAFGELTCPVEQRARFVADQATRQALGRLAYGIDERFIAALEQGMPPAAGIALGVDRLVMLLCDAREIGDVVAFAPREV